MKHSSDEGGDGEWVTDDEEDEDDDGSNSEDEDDESGSEEEDEEEEEGDEEGEKSLNDTDDVNEEAKKADKKLTTETAKKSKLDRKKEKLEKKIQMKIEKKKELTAHKKAKASQISVERLLGDDDFKKIDAELIKQQVTRFKKGVKRPREEDPNHGELVKLADIENIYKKRKHDKESRMDSIKVCSISHYMLLIYRDTDQLLLVNFTTRHRFSNRLFANFFMHS